MANLTSVNTHLFWKYGSNNKIIELLNRSGFDAYDFSMFNGSAEHSLFQYDDYKERASELKKYADKLGIKCNQAHAPFPTVIQGDPEKTELRKQEIIRSMEIASILGAKVIVVHPWNYYSPEQNAKILEGFLPYCKKFDIKIAVENMWCWDYEKDAVLEAACSHPENFIQHMNLLDKNWFVACVDIGHAEMFNDVGAPKLITSLKNRVQVLHIHDNDKIHDLHSIPFDGMIDFSNVVDALKEINYQGDYTLEVERPANHCLNDIHEEYYEGLAKLLVNVSKSIKNATTK